MQRKLDREQKSLQKEDKKEREKRNRKADSKKLGKKNAKDGLIYIKCAEVHVEHEINNLNYKCHNYM